MTTAIEPARAALASILGESRVVTDAAECEAYAVDGRAPKCVVYPSSAEQVAAALKCAAERELAVIPLRGGTKIAVGNRPRRYDAALSLKELNRVWHYEPADLTVSVEAGMKFGDLQSFIGRRGLWLPLDPAGGARASLGGIAATNSAGPLRFFYGTPRDMVLGMKIATTEGKIIKAGGRVVKNVAGYDVAKLLIGSYGSLGVIVEVSLKLFPLPARRTTFVLVAGMLEKARELRRMIQQSSLRPLRFILLDPGALSSLEARTGLGLGERVWQIWVEAGGTPNVLDRYSRELQAIGRAAAAPFRSVDGGRDANAVWDKVAGFDTDALTSPGDLVLRASLPSAASEGFIIRAYEEADLAKARLACRAETCAGIVRLHPTPPMDDSVAEAFIRKLRSLAENAGGTLMIEVGPVEVKRHVDAWGSPGDDFEIMRKLKQTWDPKGILSPGRFLGGL